MKTIKIAGSRPYDIIIEKGAINDIAKFIPDAYSNPKKFCIITDTTVSLQYAEVVASSLRAAGHTTFKILFPSGEHSKTLTTYANMLDSLADEGFTKSDIIIALGGGTVGDIAGFVAGTYMRGVNYFFIPTTLLAMVDSSLGGKTGVKLLDGKNLAGLFWSPSLVIIDPLVLETLSEDSIKDGLAEALKTGIVSDVSLIEHIQERRFDYIIDRCLSIKRPLVEVDERDTGLRQLLSFGHTIGHGIEKLSAYSISHGQAIAKGMVCEAKAAFNAGYSHTNISDELIKLLTDLGLDTEMEYGFDEIYEETLLDKKIRDGFINIIVPDVIGKCSIRKITLAELEDYIRAAFE